MEIIITNKQLLELAKIHNADIVEGIGYNGRYKYKFVSLTSQKLAKSILYVDHENKYYLEQRR